MEGKITFNTTKELAEFLKEFTGCTATFTVNREGDGWVLKFNGGF